MRSFPTRGNGSTALSTRWLSGENDPNWLPWLTMRPPGHAPPSPRVQLDLIAANRVNPGERGSAAARIFCSDFCTACRTDLFFSYRARTRHRPP